MHKFNKSSFLHFAMIIYDVLAILVAFLATYAIGSALDMVRPIQDYLFIGFVFIPMFIAVMKLYRLYNKLTFTYYDRIVRNTFYTVFQSTVSIGLMILLEKNMRFSEGFFLTFMTLTFVLVSSYRTFYCAYLKRRNNGLTRSALLVGEDSILSKFNYYVNKTNYNIRPVGYVSLDDGRDFGLKPLLGRLEDLEMILRSHVVDEVIFAIGDKQVSKIEEYVALCESMGITARLVLDFYNLNISKAHFTGIGTLPMLTLHTVSLNVFELFLKRALDIVGALFGLVITGLITLVLYPIVKMDSPGPVFFTQKRVGINGRIFNIWKFRTMYIDAEQRKKELMEQNKISGGLMFKMDDDPRVTRVGRFLRKTSLDEFPQFINVLKGDMSLVGTRPPTVDEVNRYETHHYRRISIKPGLTGMWQITGRSEVTNFDKVVELDTEYIDQWSIWLDIKIILKTFGVVFARRGAY